MAPFSSPPSPKCHDNGGCGAVKLLQNKHALSTKIDQVSDRCSRGEAEDKSGDNLERVLSSGEIIQGVVKGRVLVPDEISEIQKAIQLASRNVDVIFTTGGTGCAPPDVTPEAVKGLIQKEAPGLTVAMITESLKITPMAMLSRAVCGIYDNTLIITLPGSTKGSEECLRVVAPALKHAVDLLRDDKMEVDETHKSVQKRHCCGHTSRHSKSNVSVVEVAKRPRKTPYPTITVDEAQNIILKECYKMEAETIDYSEARGHVLNLPVFSKYPLPPFPASIKDGYGVIAADGAGVREVIGDSTAGKKGALAEVKSGTCVRVSTGAKVPDGADAVVQVEDTKLIASSPGGTKELQVEICVVPKVGQDIRPTGCDISQGEQVLAAGTMLGPSELGVLASIGHTQVCVYRKPVTGVMSTGDELQEPDDTSVTAIRDSNRIALLSIIKEANYPTLDCGIAIDEPEAVRKAINNALSLVDVLVTSGGMSMGEKDVLKAVLQQDFDATIHFGRVMIKPGKPTAFATCMFNGKKKLILGLPGNPVPCLVISQLYVLPLLKALSGHCSPLPLTLKAKIATRFELDPRPEYHRVALNWEGDDPVPVATSTGNQLSSRLLSMRGANALLMLPPRSDEVTSVSAGTVLSAILLR